MKFTGLTQIDCAITTAISSMRGTLYAMAVPILEESETGMSDLLKYYENYDEDNRFDKDNAHKIEFLTTIDTLKYYIKQKSKILDLGAGTGVYSIYYAQKGHNVTAIDINLKHINILLSKIKKIKKNKKLSINAEVGNAIKLSKYKDEEFDIVLNMGPFYHIQRKSDRLKSLSENLRVLKRGGILALAYINKIAVYIVHIIRDKDFIKNNDSNRFLSSKYIDSGVFYFVSPAEIESLTEKFSLQIIDHVGSDGITPIIHNFINNLEKQDYDKWLNFHRSTCREKSIMGYSLHGLCIFRKQ